jgi:protein-S-isoprenylcysteine O-methyltransferase Ste14
MSIKTNFYRTAISNNGIWNVVKTLLQTSAFWVVFLYFIPGLIIEFEHHFGIKHFENGEVVGWLLLIVFSLLGLYSGYTMSWFGKGTPLPLDCPQKLVIAGPYKYVRNPMAVAGIGQGISVGVIFGSPMVILYAVSGAFLWH